jgi:hypothetical protein
VCKRGSPDVITSRVVRAPRQGLSSSRRANGGPPGARDASQACVGVDAGRPCSVQTIETVCGLRTQGSTGVELGTLRPSTSGSLAAGSHLPRSVGFGRLRAAKIKTVLRVPTRIEPCLPASIGTQFPVMSARGSCYGVRSARGPNCSAIISGVLKGFLQLLNP